jgi:hypothetical protein
MSLHPHVIEPVPEETARVARAVFPKGHPSLTFRDALGTVFQDGPAGAFKQKGTLSSVCCSSNLFFD